MEEINKLIKKYNNIEKNAGLIERYYHLGECVWYVGNDALWVGDSRANKEEIKEFLKLKKEVK